MSSYNDSVDMAKKRHPSGHKPPRVILTAADRCDRCGAQAYFRLAKVLDLTEQMQRSVKLLELGLPMEPPTLDFCGHHAKKHGEAMADDWTVVGNHPDYYNVL